MKILPLQTSVTTDNLKAEIIPGRLRIEPEIDDAGVIVICANNDIIHFKQDLSVDVSNDNSTLSLSSGGVRVAAFALGMWRGALKLSGLKAMFVESLM